MMNHDLSVTGKVRINADAEKIKEYLFGTETVTDWQPGSPIVFQGAYNGQQYRDHGVVLEHIPGRRLRYSYWSGFTGLPDEPGNYSEICYLIEPLDHECCDFLWIQKGYSSEAGYQHSLQGMDEFMKTIKAIAER